MRTWLVIPAMGMVSALAGLAITAGAPLAALAAGLAGAAIAAMIRALVGDSPASLAASAIAPVLAIVLVADRAPAIAAPCLALGAAAWTFAELSRTTTSPLVAMLPASIAAVLYPGFVALVPIAGWRLVTAPWERPPWIVAVPIAGAVLTLVAIAAGLADGGAFGTLGAAWFGARDAIAPGALARSIAEGAGPLVAVAACAGLYVLARVHVINLFRTGPSLAIACCYAGAVLVDLRGGAASPVMLGLVATSAALAIGRVAAMIPLASGQAFVGGTLGGLVVLPQAWMMLERALG